MSEREDVLLDVIRHTASYKDAVFLLSSSDTSGGRKTAVKKLIGSKKQVIEDLGGNPRSFTLNGFLSAIGSRSYRDIRDDFLRKVESPGSGRLVHPFFGVIENIVVTSFTVTESIAEVGTAKITINCEVSDSDGVPLLQEAETAIVEDIKDQVEEEAEKSIVEKFLVRLEDAGNFADSLQQQLDFAGSTTDSVALLSASREKIDAFRKRIRSYEASVVKFVNAPATMAAEMRKVYASINSLYDQSASAGQTLIGVVDAPTSSLTAFERLFAFGDSDISFPLDTSARQNRQRNRSSVLLSVKSSALASQYSNAVNVSYNTAEDIEAAVATLDSNFQSLSPELEGDLLSKLIDLRIASKEVFDTKLATARRVTTVLLNPVSTRLLAYRYYGTSDAGEALQKLNEVPTPFVQGSSKILTA